MDNIYDANINFSAAFLIWVLVIRSLQSMLFSLEYKLKNTLIKMFKFGKYLLNKTNNFIELSLRNIFQQGS